MGTLVRKQIYINKRHDAWLKRQARLRGVSQAELIRLALDRTLTEGGTHRFQPDADAFSKFEKFIVRHRQGVQGTPYHWNREDAYQDRIKSICK